MPLSYYLYSIQLAVFLISCIVYFIWKISSNNDKKKENMQMSLLSARKVHLLIP
uniref:Uncharacterized protein n=1 Tax=Triticum urartu TaxID=4572 RepID=A0A8R7PCU8_TRIUA